MVGDRVQILRFGSVQVKPIAVNLHGNPLAEKIRFQIHFPTLNYQKT